MKINIEPWLGLRLLQENVMKKAKFCNETTVTATQVATYNEQQKIKINLNWRVEQIKQRNIATISDPENKLDNINSFCYNKLDFSWEEAINNLAARFEISSYELLPISSNEIIHLASLELGEFNICLH